MNIFANVELCIRNYNVEIYIRNYIFYVDFFFPKQSLTIFHDHFQPNMKPMINNNHIYAKVVNKHHFPYFTIDGRSCITTTFYINMVVAS
jgi:hypothetical protein